MTRTSLLRPAWLGENQVQLPGFKLGRKKGKRGKNGLGNAGLISNLKTTTTPKQPCLTREELEIPPRGTRLSGAAGRSQTGDPHNILGFQHFSVTPRSKEGMASPECSSRCPGVALGQEHPHCLWAKAGSGTAPEFSARFQSFRVIMRANIWAGRAVSHYLQFIFSYLFSVF